MTSVRSQRVRTPSQLRVLMAGRPAGWLRRDRNGRVSFDYDQEYAGDARATPLSVVLPLTQAQHVGKRLEAWLANLLPDNDRVLDRWAQRFQVSANSPFALLAHVGSDCAGAVAFVPEDRIEALGTGGLTPLSVADVGRRLAELTVDPAAWTPRHEGGQFSLAGTQAKVALRWDGRQWSEAWGSEATSHILKPPMQGLACQELNEHLCLRIARRVGLPAAESQVLTLGGQQVIAVTRYDRVLTANGLLRLHQEDLCQALGVRPASKYQAEGGPGPADIIALLRRVMPADIASRSVGTFLDALALSWVLGATDAHAKNYSLLLNGPDVRLAPLYDINSVLPYLTAERRGVATGQVSMHTARLAMSIGGKARLADVDGDAWAVLARGGKLDPARLLERVGELIDATVEATRTVIEQEVGALDEEPRQFADRLEKMVVRRAGLCRSALVGRVPPPPRRRQARPVGDGAVAPRTGSDSDT